MDTSTIDFRASIKSDHRSILSARLRSVEKDCLQLLDLLRPFDSALVRRRPLAAEKAEPLQRLVTELRSKIALVVENLGLGRALQDAAQETKSLTETMLADLAEMHPDHLAKYSPVPDDLTQYLQAHVADLQVTVAKIRGLLAKPTVDIRNAGR